MTEQQIQKKISDHLEKKGYFVLKLIKTNRNGCPDLVAIHGQEEAFFIEVKKPEGKLSNLQRWFMKDLEKKSIRSYVAYGYDDYFDKVGKYL